MHDFKVEIEKLQQQENLTSFNDVKLILEKSDSRDSGIDVEEAIKNGNVNKLPYFFKFCFNKK